MRLELDAKPLGHRVAFIQAQCNAAGYDLRILQALVCGPQRVSFLSIELMYRGDQLRAKEAALSPAFKLRVELVQRQTEPRPRRHCRRGREETSSLT